VTIGTGKPQKNRANSSAGIASVITNALPYNLMFDRMSLPLFRSQLMEIVVKRNFSTGKDTTVFQHITKKKKRLMTGSRYHHQQQYL
jgi:hypothetical protein